MANEIKSLTINGVVYAKYLMDGETIHLSMESEVIPEDAVIQLIALIENRKFAFAGFLNVDAHG